MGEFIGYLMLVVLVLTLVTTVNFAWSFWQGKIGGEYGVSEHTTLIGEFSYDLASLPDHWLVNASQTNYASFSDGQAGGCSVDISRSDGIDISPAWASRYLEGELDRAIADMRTSGYTIIRDEDSQISVNTSSGQVSWPSYEFSGQWLDSTAEFNQISSMMLGDNYLLQIGMVCGHDNFAPSFEVLNQVRFN